MGVIVVYGKKIPVVVTVLFISDKKLSSLVFSYLVSVSGSCRADVANKIFSIRKSKSKSKTRSKRARVVQEQQGEHEQ